MVRRTVIDWDGNPVNALEVEQKQGPLTMRTWVRTDGMILRQEVPFPFVRLMLERRPEDVIAPESAPVIPPKSSAARSGGPAA